MEWDEFTEDLKTLAAKVRQKPDIIVGVVRGGLIPARLLSTHLGVKDMYCLTANFAIKPYRPQSV